LQTSAEHRASYITLITMAEVVALEASPL